MATLVPTEDQEQAAFVQWLQLKGLKYWRTPNETFTRSWKQRAKNKRLGVMRGVPDMFVIVNNRLIAIEMKRTKGSATSPEQREWIEALNAASVPAFVCKGAEAAIAAVESISKGDKS